MIESDEFRGSFLNIYDNYLIFIEILKKCNNFFYLIFFRCNNLRYYVKIF